MKKGNTLARVIAVLVALLGMTGAGIAAWAYYLNTPVTAENDTVYFTVHKGESVSSIASRLEEKGVVRSARLLSLVSRVNNTSGRFQAGNYLMKRNMTTLEVHDFFITGSQILNRVTIPEGWTTRKIGGHLEREGITTAALFQAACTDPLLLTQLGIPGESAEGYLYPDTYMFPADYPAEEIVKHMVGNFFNVVSSVYPEYKKLSAAQLHQKVIIASIVEREYLTPEEAPDMASVFYNRLNANMRLESCATVVYVMTEQEGLPHPRHLYYADLERPSSYNTYLHRGLPPGPISNPGRVALDAAFHPSDTDYWFFVLKGQGATEHYFSRTLAEHNRAAVLYLKSP